MIGVFFAVEINEGGFVTPTAGRRSNVPLTKKVGLTFGEVNGIQFIQGDYITQGTKVTRQHTMKSKEIQNVIKEGSCISEILI